MDAPRHLSWNVQGLGGQAFRRFKGLLRSDLGTSNIGIIDILFLQEHHMCMDMIHFTKILDSFLGSCLWSKWPLGQIIYCSWTIFCSILSCQQVLL